MTTTTLYGTGCPGFRQQLRSVRKQIRALGEEICHLRKERRALRAEFGGNADLREQMAQVRAGIAGVRARLAKKKTKELKDKLSGWYVAGRGILCVLDCRRARIQKLSDKIDAKLRQIAELLPLLDIGSDFDTAAPLLNPGLPNWVRAVNRRLWTRSGNPREDGEHRPGKIERLKTRFRRLERLAKGDSTIVMPTTVRAKIEKKASVPVETEQLKLLARKKRPTYAQLMAMSALLNGTLHDGASPPVGGYPYAVRRQLALS